MRGAARPSIRSSLGGLLALGAVNALAGGYYGMAGAKGVPIEWLRGSPFPDYFAPSLILFCAVGGSFLAAAFLVFARSRLARAAAQAAGVILLGWMAVQLGLIGFVSWLQPLTIAAGIAILALAWQLPRAAAAGESQASAPPSAA